MSIKRISYFIFVLAISVRCSDIDYKNRTPEKINVSLSSEEHFEVRLRGLDQPNKFKALVQYSGPTPGSWTVLKKSNQLKVTSFELGEKRDGSIEDLDIEFGQTYNYLIGRNVDGEFQIAKEIEIIPPEDLVVEGQVTLESLERLKTRAPIFRVFFKKDSILKTSGQNVEFDVQEIYSENGKLQTFSPGDSAPIGHEGAPSGHVHIKANRITGPFTIEVRGQRGGQGQKGAIGQTGSVGPASLRQVVDIGHEIISQAIMLCNQSSFDRAPRNPCRDSGIGYEECRIKYHVGVGGKGGPGGVGFQGLPGFKGGDAQDSSLEVESALENVTIIFEPGEKGPGGEGGDGGLGGPGGPGAPIRNNSPGIPCDGSPAGPIGDRGPGGPKGPDGIPGNKGRFIFNGVEQ